MCGVENDSSTAFCGECGARLRPVSSITTEAEPTQRAPSDGLSPPEEPTGELDLSSLPGAPGGIPEEVPPWLEQLLVTHGLVEPEEEEIEPLHLRRVAEPDRERELAEEPVPLAETDTEEWLSAMRESAEEPASVEPEEVEETEAVDWLDALRSEGEPWEPETEEAEETALPLDEDTSDWLRSLREPGAEIAVESPETDLEEEGLPDWLRELGAPGAEEESPLPEELPLAETPVAEEEDLPDWLRELGAPGAPGAEEEESSLAETPVAEEEALPDWLRELGGPSEAEELPLLEEPPFAETPVAEEEKPSAVEVPPLVESPEVPVTDEEELPPWLVELRDEVFEEEPFEETDGAEIPDWLREVGEPEGEAEWAEPPTPGAPHVPVGEVEAGQVEKEAEIEVPEWLQEIRGVEPVPTEELPGEEPTLPDWLAQPAVPEVIVEEEVSAPDWLQGPVPTDREVTPEDEDRPPPDWLEELRLSAEVPVEEEAPPFVGEEREELAEITEPSISAELPSLEEPPVAEVEGHLARADIPDWMLALRPREPGEESAEEQGIVELSGPLAGIKGILPVEPVITFPHLARPEPVVAEAPPVSGDLFAEIVAQPSVSTAAAPRRAKMPFVAGVQRVLIYLLLLAAVVVPILMVPIYGPADAEALQTGAEAVYTLLDGRGAIGLPVDSVVVVAFDYNPATAAELSLQARAILDHLMRRRVRIMAISLYPEGAALAGDLLDELAAKQGYTYGEDYLHLGYLPNQPVSVRYFLNSGPAGKGRTDYRNGREVSRYPVAQGVKDLSAVRLVIELAGNDNTLRTWVEQIAVRANVPVVAGVSAAIAPYAWPYLDSGQLQALLVGLPGAAEYEAQAGRQGKAIDSLGSQVAAQSAIVLLIVLGNLVHLVTRGGKK